MLESSSGRQLRSLHVLYKVHIAVAAGFQESQQRAVPSLLGYKEQQKLHLVKAEDFISEEC